MRKILCFLNALLLLTLLFSASLTEAPAWAEPVTIKGQRLSEIDDIVKTVTSSDFPEIPKHSLLLFERIRLDEGDMRYQSHVLTISRDGSLRKEYPVILNDNSEYVPVKPSAGVIQRMDLSMSPKPFGSRRNIFYATAGLSDSEYSRYGVQMLESSGTEDSAQIDEVDSDYYYVDETSSNRNSWGSACLSVPGMEDKDVVVVAHSSKMNLTGDLKFEFSIVHRNATNYSGAVYGLHYLNVEGGDGNQYLVFNYGAGIRGCSIAACDIDGDGYKNEIAMTWTENDGTWMYCFQVQKSGDNVSVSKLLDYIIDSSGGYNDDGYMGYRQSCPNTVTGDFDGDGRDEIAFVGRVFPFGENCMRVHIADYNPDNGSWNHASDGFDVTPNQYHNAESPCKAARCDFDGDGKDELAILFFQEPVAGTLYPRLERWYCDAGSITPHRDYDHKKGGPGDTSVLGYTTKNTNDYYKNVEEFSIIAGPLTGTKGKLKLADDVAISYVNSDRSSVYVIPTVLDANGDFSRFGESHNVFNYEDSSEGRRGALLTSDFANEALMLGTPSHTQDQHDQSYVTVLQALPYHVDNVDQNGNLTSYPINYSFSGFGDLSDGIKGEMRVAYSSSTVNEQDKSVSFGLASTTETISILGKAGPYVEGYLKFRTAEANIAGNFDPRIKAAAGVMNAIMNFVTDKIDNTTTNASSSAHKTTVKDGIDARQFDRIVSYTAPQHIWRYPILNNPLPSWFVVGPKADYVSKDFSSEAESQTHYITFSMYDASTPAVLISENDYGYQARHEEGNFFSYPSEIEDIEGYTSGGDLIDQPYSAAWAKANTGKTITFSETQINSLSYDQHVHKSELSKIISTVASWFNAKDPTGLPPYTSHSESFVKKYSSSEAIEIDVYGWTTLPGEAASHILKAMPYVTREGTMKVGTAVELIEPGYQDSPALWRPNSRYSRYPDPSLVLPYKYVMTGAAFSPSDQTTASRARGVRYYVPALDMDADNNILGGFEYQIQVPLYNASFRETGDFQVSLFYVAGDDFSLANPTLSADNLQHIQTITMSLDGWQNGSRKNKGWAVFTWNVPENLSEGVYYLYVKIDPENKLEEGHESRLDENGAPRDWGGNNEGYFKINYSSPGALEKKASASSFKAAAHSGNGTIFRTVYRDGDADGGVSSAMNIYDTTGTVSVKAKFNGYEDIDIPYLLGMIREVSKTDSRDAIPVECELTYTGDEYYPEAYFYGIRCKAGAMDTLSGDYSNISDDVVSEYFLVDKLPLVPNKTLKFTIRIYPGEIDWVNGSGFQLVVPELAANVNSKDVTPSDPPTPTEPTDPEEPEDNSEIGVSSTSGGCETGTGIFAAVILAGAAVLGKMKRK